MAFWGNDLINVIIPDSVTTIGNYAFYYNYLETMKPGKVIKLIASEDRIEWLIKTVCLFIASGEHWREYELNADYTKIRRMVIPEKWKHRCKRFDIKKP